ncbi:hypothetical protein [Clostridium sp.]|uniref:hypothetical protein n=1 Tax=Clostridium sp. TaxID=1506 RepID=UPI0026033549|nr:hypothetical protein [Clostridium sp.]
MGLKLGQKVMVVPEHGRHKEGKQKYGRIHSISKFNIVVDYKGYKESFNLADLITGPQNYKFKIWTGSTWENVHKKINSNLGK